MKEDVILINTARGNLFNEQELYEVLSERPNMSMGIDVYEIEPYPNGDLLKLDNVLLTPHIGSYTSKAREDMEKEAVENIQEYLK
jgi:gluconate 2-dehydrogenase